MWICRFTLVVLVLILTVPCGAQQKQTKPGLSKSVRPGINSAFLDPQLDVNVWINRFESESREIAKSRHEILRNLQIKAGDHVADVGAGTGLFIEPLSKLAGDKGWVYALEISPKFLQHLGRLVDEQKLANVTPALSGENDIRLPPGSLDVVFICDVYHHFEYPAQSLKSIRRALKPGGTMVVIDFERIPGVSREWVVGHVRAGKEVFRGEIEQAGFQFVEEVGVSGLSENYFLRFRRPK